MAVAPDSYHLSSLSQVIGCDMLCGASTDQSDMSNNAVELVGMVLTPFSQVAALGYTHTYSAPIFVLLPLEVAEPGCLNHLSITSRSLFQPLNLYF